MYQTSLIVMLVFLGALAAIALARWVFAVRSLREDAQAEYADRERNKPASIHTVDEAAFTAIYLRSFQPRSALYIAGALGSALVVSPLALIAVAGIYDLVWRALGEPATGIQAGYIFMFSVFFGVALILALLAAVFARLFHARTPEPFHHALARARGEPIPEDTGWRRRPKWARRVRPD